LNAITRVRLADESVFQLVSGLWAGDRPPLVRAKVVRSTDFRGDGFLDYTNVAQLDVAERQLATRSLRKGDIIVERSGGGPKQPVGRVALFTPDAPGPFASSNFTTSIRVIDRDRLDPFFVALYLHHIYLCGATNSLQRATTGLRNLAWSEYLQFEIPVPALREQQQMVSVLLLARSAYLNAQAQSQCMQGLKRVVMRELFTRGLGRKGQPAEHQGVPSDWEVCSIGNHFALSAGGTPSRANTSFWTKGTIPWVKTGEVNYRAIDQTEECITELGLRHSAAKLHPPGTLLIAMYGQGITRGKVAILGIEAACNQACAAFRPLDDAVTTKFLYYWLTYQYDELRRFSHGGQQQNLNMDIVRAFRLTHPHDTTEQSEMVNILEAIDYKVELHMKRHRLLEELFKLLLFKLMTGEIRASDLNLSALEEQMAS
jgi:type I restriction enzyme, S subunit